MELTRVSRPVRFEDYIGNADTVGFLKTDVANRKLFNKIILNGVPGIGKSTLAIILAMAVQCENNLNGNPCLQCDHCKEIIEKMVYNNENCCNIYRFNMSDRKGIEDAREIKEIFDYRKSSKYNATVLILEEPQRMSRDAQDYLNVPLEYLPDHVKIIFTTTELNAISDAIQSRSKVYNLKTPSNQETMSLLDRILQHKFGKQVPKQMLQLIVEYSNGVPRDSINNLEKIIQTGDLSINSINAVLGMMNFEYYIQYFQIAHKDIMVVAKFLDDLKNKGVSYLDFVRNLHIFMTDLFKMKFDIPNIRYTKSQTKLCKEIIKDYKYSEFMRLQILATQLAVTELNTRYQTERLAESLLYEFALKVNQKFDVDDYFKDTSNDHSIAVKAHQEKDHEKFLATKTSVLSSTTDVLTQIAEATGEGVKIVRTREEIQKDSDTNIVY